MNNSSSRVLLTCLAALLASCFAHTPTSGCEGCISPQNPTQAFVKVEGKIIGTGKGFLGSAFAVATDEHSTYLVTAEHVCSMMDGSEIPIEHQDLYRSTVIVTGTNVEGKSFPLTVVDKLKAHDLCIVKAHGVKLPSLNVAEQTPVLGEVYTTISSPQGWGGPGRALIFEGRYGGNYPTEQFGLTDLYTIPGDQGSSGSPILDMRGEVVGIISMAANNTEVGICLSPQHENLRTFVTKVLCDRKIQCP